MNYATINGEQVQPNTCGLLALDNHAVAFWQSRINAFDPPRLIDIPALAQAVRETWEGFKPCAG